MIRESGIYRARNTSMGALVDEAGRVLGGLNQGQSLTEAKQRCHSGDLLSQRSIESRKRIWTSLNHRLFAHGVTWAIEELKHACAADPHGREFISLLYLHYALRDSLTFDLVTDVLWSKGYQSQPAVTSNDVRHLLDSVTDQQPQIERWTEKSREKLARGILTPLRDFGLLDGKQKKYLVRPVLPLSTAEHLLRILVSEGRGRDVIEAKTWRLFMLTEQEVSGVLARLAQDGCIRFEKAGGTVILETPPQWEEAA
ncbi:MAG: DUF1819 family protein [Planctomycetia bacterium]|nr:DUF1819 family protein [Planctomycetia bacterium]